VKKIICGFLICLLIGMLAVPTMAASDPPEITLQPQSPANPEYGVAIYTVEANGTNLSATWYMQWQGNTYTISQIGGTMQDWEGYAGEAYGARQLDDHTFAFIFEGIGAELDGAYIWCVLEDGHYDVTSQKARIIVGENETPPTILEIPAQVNVEQGDEAVIRCVANAPTDTQLSYIWYETDSGKLEDIRAVNRGEETSDYMFCDTSTIGTRMYICMVQTTEGGTIYSSYVPVTVTQKAAEPTQPSEQPTQNTEATETTEATTPPTQSHEATQPVEESKETTPQSQQTEPTTVTTTGDGQSSQTEMPWWAMVLIGLVAAGAGVGVAMILVKKK